MLETLRIRNYALIDSVEVDFHDGFNVLTGETGAGKSIVVGALNLVLGARVSGDVLRDGAARADIEAVFRIARPSARLAALLKENDIVLEDGGLLLSRSMSADGRSKGYAGGKIVPISVLAEVGDELVDLHGQHEHQSLLKIDRQLDLLDGFGDTESAAEQVAAHVARLRALDREMAALESDDRERARRFEFLQFEVKEIDAAGLHLGEDDELKLRLNLINNAETIFSLAQLAYTTLYENEVGAAIDAIDTAARQLDELSVIDPGFQPLVAQLAEARAMVESVAMEARSQAERREFDPHELDELNRRQAQIATLKRKYGSGIPEILAYRDKAAAEVEAYERRDERLEALRKEQEQLRAQATLRATELSGKRKAAARRLDKQVAAVLQDLGMKGAQFETVFETTDLGAHGVDRVEFLLAANLGEKAKPLRQVASGGEISRIMLALKTVFAKADKIPSLVFDEIDAGVGGAVARNVAEKLSELARSHQVICITHIAQIAAAAGGHFTVSKHTHKGRTITSLAPVSEEERVREVARLLDGSVSEVSLEHARALLETPARER